MNKEKKKTKNAKEWTQDDKIFAQGPIKTLLWLYKGYTKDLIIAMIYYLIKSSPLWIIPLLTAGIINVVTAPDTHSLNEIWVYAIIAAVVIAQNIPVHYLFARKISVAIRHVEAHLRSTLIRKLQQISMTSHKEMNTGRIQSKVLRDVESIEMLSNQLLLNVIPQVATTLISFSIVLGKSLIVAVFFVVTIPIVVTLVRFFKANIRNTNQNFRKSLESMTSKVNEMVEMIPVTKAHGLENVEIQKMDHVLNNVQHRGYKLDITNALFGASSWVSFQSISIACLIFTAILAYYKMIQVGDVVMYQNYFTQIIGSVNTFIAIYPAVAKGLESVRSIGEIINNDDIEDNSGKMKLTDLKGKYDFEEVSFAYRGTEKHVLDHFSFEVNPGECVAFVGESGAGKSTILNIVIGFLKPVGGKVLVDGYDLNDIDFTNYRNQLAVVTQKTVLFSGSIKDNITYGLNSIPDEKVMEVVRLCNLSELVESLPGGIHHMIGESGNKLSEGQKQRLAIARAMIRDPKVIVLDEATSALDNISEAYVQQALNNLFSGRTTFMVAHRLSTIKNADKIAFIKDGKCVECGTYDELMALHGEFYNLQHATIQA